MDRLDRWMGRRRAGVRWAEGALPGDLARRARAAGVRLVRVRAGRASDKERLLDALARGLAFPAHFGANWDALHDCLTDLSWMGEGGLLVVVQGLDALARSSPGDLRRVLEVLRDASGWWAVQGRTVLFLLQGGPAPRGVTAIAPDDPG